MLRAGLVAARVAGATGAAAAGGHAHAARGDALLELLEHWVEMEHVSQSSVGTLNWDASTIAVRSIASQRMKSSAVASCVIPHVADCMPMRHGVVTDRDVRRRCNRRSARRDASAPRAC